MVQRVVVENASGASRTFNATMGRIQRDWSVEQFEPADLVISAGDTVIWTNFDPSEMHTVTGHEGGAARYSQGSASSTPAFDSSPALTADALAAAGAIERAQGGF